MLKSKTNGANLVVYIYGSDAPGIDEDRTAVIITTYPNGARALHHIPDAVVWPLTIPPSANDHR